MEHATTLEQTEDVYEPSLTPDSLGKLGMWIFLVGDTMSFGALLAAYAAVRAGAGVIGWVPPDEILGINLTAFMTFLLICSSVTMVKALEAIQNGNVSRMCTFLGLTIAGGVIFLGLQVYEWNALIKHGLTLTEIPHQGYQERPLAVQRFSGLPSIPSQGSMACTSPAVSSTSPSSSSMGCADGIPPSSTMR